jgi:hypothetical protein
MLGHLDRHLVDVRLAAPPLGELGARHVLLPRPVPAQPDDLLVNDMPISRRHPVHLYSHCLFINQ